MDFPSHFIWAYIFFRHQPWLWSAVAFCLLPDVLWWVPMVARQKLFRHAVTFHDMQAWYKASHSLVTQALAVPVVFVLAGAQFATGAAAGWFLHFFMDIWTHRGGIVNGIAPFFPFSNWRFPALLWWTEEVQKRRWVYLANLGVAALAYYLTQ